MIKNIIFDIGNVLTDFAWKEFLANKGCDAEMIKRVAKATVMTPVWDEIDKGTITVDEAFAAFGKADPEIADLIYNLFIQIEGMVTPRDYAIPWVKDLKARGYGVYYLSNFSEKAYYDCADSITFIPYTDGGILSYREHVTKPDPKIYQILLERYSLKPEECIFFDDTPKNVEAAIELGFNAFVFTTKEQAEKDIASLV